MSHNYYKRAAVLSIGGFNEELQVMEHVDVMWKLEKAGYTIKGTDEITFIHDRPVSRFSIRTVIEHAFVYGYCWYKLSRAHPDKTGLSAYPFKLVFFVTFTLISLLYPITFLGLLAVVSFWLTFKLYRDRRKVRNCITHMNGIVEKIMAFLIVIFIVVLMEIVRDVGKLFAFSQTVIQTF